MSSGLETEWAYSVSALVTYLQHRVNSPTIITHSASLVFTIAHKILVHCIGNSKCTFDVALAHMLLVLAKCHASILIRRQLNVCLSTRSTITIICEMYVNDIAACTMLPGTLLVTTSKQLQLLVCVIFKFCL